MLLIEVTGANTGDLQGVANFHELLAVRRDSVFFSRDILGETTVVVFLAQHDGMAGIWPIGVTGSNRQYIAFLACEKRTDISITALS